MVKKPSIEHHGIIAVAVDEYPVSEIKELSERTNHPDAWLAHFPTEKWLSEQIALARAVKPEGLFIPFEDWGWYAEQMAAFLEILKILVRNGDAAGAATYAAEIATLATESNIKFQWEADALRGRKSSEGSLSGAAARAAAFRSRHEEIREYVRARFESHGDERRAKEAAARHFQISRRQLNRILKK